MLNSTLILLKYFCIIRSTDRLSWNNLICNCEHKHIYHYPHDLLTSNRFILTFAIVFLNTYWNKMLIRPYEVIIALSIAIIYAEKIIALLSHFSTEKLHAGDKLRNFSC